MVDFTSKHAKCKLNLFAECVKFLEEGVWSPDMLRQVESNCKLESGYHHVLFPGGLKQILLEFEQWQDSLMIADLEKINPSKKIREQIANALEVRIMQGMTKKAAINHHSAFLLPENLTLANQVALNSCDVIWKKAGDKSTDFNYYTKRGLLLGVYLSARAFYFADESENHQETKEFIKNALDNIVNLASLKHRIQLPRLEDVPILRFFL